MLLKILVVIALLHSTAFCMDEEGANANNGSSQIIRKAVVSETQTPSWSVVGLVTGVFSRILGTTQEATQRNLETAEMSRTAAVEMKSASSQLSVVTNQLHESGALLNAVTQQNQEIERLRTALLLANAEKLAAQNSLQRLLSQATPAAATRTANEERDSRIQVLEENMSRLSAQVNQIAAERSELEIRLETFKKSLAEIVDPEETDIPSLLTKTAAKMESLGQQQQESARMYSDAIRELQKQLEEKEISKRTFEGTIEKLRTDIEALRSATRVFEGNGYTRLFDIVATVSKQSSKAEIEKAEQDIIAHITYARLLTPSVPFRNLMEMENQQMWIERLIHLSLFTDLHEDHQENKDRFFTHNLSYLLISGSKLVRYNGTPIDYNKPNLDKSLRDGKLIKS